MKVPGDGRRARIDRKTAETEVRVEIDLDGRGDRAVNTGIPFFDHLLTAFAHHGGLDLRVEARGDLEVDGHHTVEDVGICLGQALREAVGEKRGIARFGQSLLPMDEALVETAIDFGGRAYLHWEVPVTPRAFGAFHTELAPEFWRALCQHAGLTLHVSLRHGENAHHCLEAAWKGVGRALNEALRRTPTEGFNSTKGWLE